MRHGSTALRGAGVVPSGQLRVTISRYSDERILQTRAVKAAEGNSASYSQLDER